MSKHTPGPWIVINAKNGLPYQICAIHGRDTEPGVVGKGILRWGSISLPSSGEGKANARLIAAAPEMLEALKVVTDTLIEWLPRIRGQRDVEELSRAYVAEQIAMAQAAIAKAEGREP